MHSVQEHQSNDFPGYSQEPDASIVAGVVSVILLEDADDVCITEFSRDDLFIPDLYSYPVQMFCNHGPSVYK